MFNANAQYAYWSGQRQRRSPTDPVIRSFTQPKIDFIMQHTEIPPDARLLDVGCGNGYFSHYLANYGTVVGIDYASAMLDMHPGAHIVQSDALTLPFKLTTFDISFCSNVLHHVPDPVQVVREMRRVSKKYVVIHEPNRNNPAMLALGLVKREERFSLKFTARYLRRLAEWTDLEIIACTTLGFVTPNRMPRPIVQQLSTWNTPHPLAAYSVLVAKRI